MVKRKEVDSLDEMVEKLNTAPSEIDARSLKRAIKDGLYALARMPHVAKKNEGPEAAQGLMQINFEEVFRKSILERFAPVKASIDRLKKDYPNDPDLEVLIMLYNDLLSDFENNRKIEFDDSFEQLMRQISQEVASSGVVEQDPDQSDIPEVISALRKCGIEAKYVVSRGNKDAKTVVLFMQSHSNPGMPEESKNAFGVMDSQEQIYKSLKAAIRSGLGSLVYAEGLPSDTGFSKRFAQEALKIESGDNSYIRLKAELGDEFDLVGFDDLGLMRTIFGNKKGMRYRVTAHNIFLADNVHDHFSETNDRLAFAVLGALHEDIFLVSNSPGNPLPFSHALAYYGYNVVVVDAFSRHMDQKAVAKLLKGSESIL